jgi:cytochrome b561
MTDTTPARYTGTTIALHWLMAALILATFVVGLYMHDLPLSPTKLKIYSWHKWAGVTAFLLVLVRLAWRAGHAPPAMPATISAWQQRAAHVGHALLYLLMIAVPLSGWLMSSASGVQTVYFGVWPIPDLLGKDKALGKQLEEVHELLNFTMITLIVGHTVVALKHHFIDRDDVLLRMRPRFGRQQESPS